MPVKVLIDEDLFTLGLQQRLELLTSGVDQESFAGTPRRLPQAREQARQDGKGIGVIGIGEVRSRNAFLQEERVPCRVVVNQAHGTVAGPRLERLGLVGSFVMGPLNFQDVTGPAT